LASVVPARRATRPFAPALQRSEIEGRVGLFDEEGAEEEGGGGRSECRSERCVRM